MMNYDKIKLRIYLENYHKKWKKIKEKICSLQSKKIYNWWNFVIQIFLLSKVIGTEQYHSWNIKQM